MTRMATAEPPQAWRQRARAAFWPCRDAEAIRRAFGLLWREAAHALPGELVAIEEEFRAALSRFGGVRAPDGGENGDDG